MNIVASFSDYVANISIFLILTTFIGIVVPSKKYKDYINLVLGFILIFIVLGPIQFMINNFTKPVSEIVASIDNRINSSTLTKEAAYYSESQKQLILSEYKTELSDKLGQLLASDSEYDVLSSDIIASDKTDNFGEIQYIYVTLTAKKSEPTQKPFIRIEPTTVETVSVFSSASTDENKEQSSSTARIKKIIADFYNLSENNIYITIDED